MTTRQELAERIFFELVEIPPAAWPHELDRRCNGDDALKAELRDLLACHARAEGFLDNAELLAQSLGLGHTRAADEHELAPGTRVGEYTVEGVLGRGGMGTVYIARQERPRRTVAIKIIRRSVSSQSLVRRFEHEADVLGRLHHPGIAQIYEAGASVIDPGQPAQPYIAMELVRGPALSVFADQQRLGTPAKLELLAKVCDAVHHAHQRGVIHRDLKPGNILVDESGQPKVLDFGVARAVDADLRVTTLQTSVGQLIGTLPYMSPEQVLADPAEVDTRSDVYALGVVLYQLLTGRLPLDLKSRSIPEAARLIRDESPVRLSSVSKLFRGDIDTIVSKAMEKAKGRRYQSAADLATDIRLHLGGRPIQAKHDSALYVLRKQMNRYKGFVAAGVVGLLSLAGFAVYAALQATRYEALAIKERLVREDAVASRTAAEANRDLAKASAAQAAEKAIALDSQLFSSTIERARLEGLAGNLPGAEDMLWRSLLINPRSQRARWGLWELYSRDPVRWTMPGPNTHNEAGDFSQDGQRVAVGAEVGSVGVYDAATGAQSFVFKAHADHIRDLSFVDQDRGLITIASDGELARWDISSDSPIEVWRLNCPDADGSFQTSNILRDGSRVWLVTDARRLWEIDAVRGTPREGRSLGPGSFSGMASSQVAGLFALGDDAAGVSIRRLADGAEVRRIQLSQRGGNAMWIGGMDFSPDGKRLAFASRDRKVRVVDLASGAIIFENAPELPSIGSLSYSPMGDRIVSAGPDQACMWDAASGKLLTQLAGLKGRVSCVRWSPAGNGILICGEGFVRMWDASPSPGRVGFSGHTSWVFGMNQSRVRPVVATCAGDYTVRLWDRSSGRELARANIPADRARTVRFSPDDTQLYVAANDGWVYVLDAATLECVQQFSVSNRELFNLHLSPNGDLLVTGGYGRKIHVMDTQTGHEVLRIDDFKQGVEDLVVDDTFSRVFAVGNGNDVRWYSLVNGAVLGSLRCDGRAIGLALAPDQIHLIIATYNGYIESWNIETSKRELRFEAHRNVITSLAISPGNRLLATGGDDGAIKLWDLSSGDNLANILARQGEVPYLAFEPSGHILQATFRGGFAGIYDLLYGNMLIAGNSEFHIQRLGPSASTPDNIASVRAWSQAILKMTRRYFTPADKRN